MNVVTKNFFVGLSLVAIMTVAGCSLEDGSLTIKGQPYPEKKNETSTSSVKLENMRTITETAVGSVEGCSVGVSNIGKDKNEFAADGLGVSLSFFKCPSSKDNATMRVYEGQQIFIGGKWLLIAEISEGGNNRGSVKIGRLPQVAYELSPNYKSQQFRCVGLEGFVFSYPVFSGWEPVLLKGLKAHNSECEILLSHVDLQKHGVSVDPVPQIKVSKEYYQGVPGEMQPPLGFVTTTNGSQTISYLRKDNYVEFWTGEAVVKIELVGIVPGYNFSEEFFWNEVLRTFSLSK